MLISSGLFYGNLVVMNGVTSKTGNSKFVAKAIAGSTPSWSFNQYEFDQAKAGQAGYYSWELNYSTKTKSTYLSIASAETLPKEFKSAIARSMRVNVVNLDMEVKNAGIVVENNATPAVTAKANEVIAAANAALNQ